MTLDENLPTILLAGAGHAHLMALRHWAGRTLPFQVVLVDPGQFTYSGMITGVLAKDYDAEAATANPRHLVESVGGILVRDRLVAVDRAARTVGLESGRDLPYDFLSLNIGSWVGGGGSGSRVYPVKPVSRMLELSRDLAASPEEEEIVVAGGGVTGSEVAACIATRLGPRGRVRLVHPRRQPAPQLPSRARRYLAEALSARGVERVRDRVGGWRGGGVAHLEGGREIFYTRLVLATGLTPPPLLSGVDLEVTANGLVVDRTLRCPGDERIFAAGDCADIEQRGLPNIGVYGVRAAAVLADNLEAAATGAALRAYRPQRVYLSILNLGRGEGLAVWWRLALGGRLALRWKDWIDRRFMRQLR